MKIAAVCTAYHEPWIGDTIKHLVAEGIDGIYIKMPLEDRDNQYFSAHRHVDQWFDFSPEEFHDQPRWINELANLAHDRLNDDDLWILPFDADEFFYSPMRPETIRQTLERIPEEIPVLTAPRYLQHDWWHCEPQPSGLSKMVYRWNPDVKIGPGNHTLTGLAPDSIQMLNGLFIREWQYRDYAHFKRKIEERSRTIDPSFPPEMGWHIRQYSGKPERDVYKAWREFSDERKQIWAPLPTRAGLRPDYGGEEFTLPVLRTKMAQTPCDIAGHLERLAKLVHETSPRFVIECGTNTGMSTIAFLSTGVDVYSCDYAGFDTVRPEVAACQWPAGTWHPTVADDMEWEPPGPTSLIFIDTSHTYWHSLAELEKFWPLVLPGGAMAWHDTLPGEQARAHSHWSHTVDDIDHVEMYEHDNGLGVWWKKR